MLISRDRMIEIGLGLIVVVLAVVLLTWQLGIPIEPASHPIAIALMQEVQQGEENAWPPRGRDLHEALTATAGVSAISESSHTDAGHDAGHFDAGPPLPEPPPDTSTFHVRQEERDGIYYLEVVIGEAEFEDELPMVVVLHGRGGSAQIPGGPFLGLTHPVRVIVPQAPEHLGDGYEWLPVYVGQGLVDRLSSTLFQQASRVAGLLRDLVRERPTMGRVIVSGFSQGGLLTITMALYHDDVVGEAFPLSCWLPPPLVPTYRRPDLVYPRIRSMHGTADTTIPLAPTREMFEQLVALGFDATLVTFEGVTHTISDDENTLFHLWLEAAVCRVTNDADCEAVAEDAARAQMPAAETLGLDAGAKFDDAAVDDDDVDLDAAPLEDDAGLDAAAP